MSAVPWARCRGRVARTMSSATVPCAQVFGAANKFALIVVAKKFADTIKVEWEDSGPAPEPAPAAAPPDISDAAPVEKVPEKEPSPAYKPMTLKERMAAFQK